tara:strand:- start:8221 stop:9051 length:831 start_codon:yes stop_codon:yes gene_type:complete
MKILNKEDLLVRANGLVYKKYAKGPFTGTAVSFHNNSQLKSRQSYKYGLPNGSYEAYFENGRLREKGEFSFIHNPIDTLYWYNNYIHVYETRENDYLIYKITSDDAAADYQYYEVFKDGKPLDYFSVERHGSETFVGRYKGRWVGEPIPEFIRDREIRYCSVQKKDALQNIRIGIWELFSSGSSSFDSNKHGVEIWHRLALFTTPFGDSVLFENRTVYCRYFYKDDHNYRYDSFNNKDGGWKANHLNKDGNVVFSEKFDAAGNLVNSRKHDSLLEF